MHRYRRFPRENLLVANELEERVEHVETVGMEELTV